MYNEELKQKFINQYTSSVSSRRNCVSAFNVLEKFEEEWGADLCTKSAEELEPAIKSLFGLRMKGRIARFSMIRAYAQWCLDNDVENACDGLLHVSLEDSEKITEQMVNSPLHLQKYLDAICYDESMQTMDDVCRCFLWLAYGGCPENEILQITTEDVDFENMVVRSDHSGKQKEYPIYREAIHAFKNCVGLDQFVYIHPNYSKEILRQRVPGKQLLRGVKTEAQLTLIRIELSKKAKNANAKGKTKQRISYYRAWLSGVFYRVRELELIGVEPDFSQLASDFMEGKTYHLESGRNLIGAKQRRLAKEYKEDYDRWKLAFFS